MQSNPHQQQLTNLLFYTLVLVLGYLVFRIFQPFLTPLGWAIVLGVVCYPAHSRVERRLGPTRAAALSTIAVALLLILPALALTAVFVREAATAASQLSASITADTLARAGEWWASIETRLLGKRNIDLATLVQQTATTLATWGAAQAGAVLRNAVMLVFHLFITLFTLFFLFRDGAAMMRGLRRILPFDEAQRERMISEARGLINATVTSGFVVSAIQGMLGGTAFAILGITAPVFWGVVMAFFSLLPLGAGVIWLPAAVWLMLTGHVVHGIILVGIGVGIIGLVDNFLRPMLLSGRSQLNALLVFISLLGGIAVFGLLGMVMGPVVLATTVGILEAHAQPAQDQSTKG